MTPQTHFTRTGTAWGRRLKVAAFAVGLVLSTYSIANWRSIFIEHIPPCSPECTSDFVTFYATAQLVVENPAALYDLDQQLAYQKQIAPLQQVLPFVYPPITALLMSPMAWLSFSNAFLLVTLINLTLLWDSLRRLNRHLGLTSDQAQWLLLITFCNYGVHQALYQGQTSVIVLYLLTRFVLSDMQADRPQTGLWIGFLCVKPQYLPVPNLILLIQAKWRALLLSIVLSVLLTAIAFLLISVDSLWQYLSLARRMATIEQDWWNQLRSMHNLRALAITWLPAGWKDYGWALSSALVIVGICWVNFRDRRRTGEFRWRWITTLLGLLLVTPHLFTHDLTLVILPCALLLSYFKARVPINVSLGLVSLGLLPIINFALPTIVAIVLLILYLVSLATCLRPSPTA